MPFLFNVPLTIVSLIIYNIFAFGLVSSAVGDPWIQTITTIELASQQRWTLLLGDLMIVGGLVMLFVEVLKATRVGTVSVLDHMLSALVFAAYLAEFLIVGAAATSVFFILTIISLIDLLAGFSITIRGARRDFAVGPDGHY